MMSNPLNNRCGSITECWYCDSTDITYLGYESFIVQGGNGFYAEDKCNNIPYADDSDYFPKASNSFRIERYKCNECERNSSDGEGVFCIFVSGSNDDDSTKKRYLNLAHSTGESGLTVEFD